MRGPCDALTLPSGIVWMMTWMLAVGWIFSACGISEREGFLKTAVWFTPANDDSHAKRRETTRRRIPYILLFGILSSPNEKGKI